jgi:hypothetical protein
MLRFPGLAVQTWGIHFLRSIPRLGEQSEWPHVPLVDRTNLVARFGYLRDLNNVEPKRNIQISPYTVSRLQRNESAETPGTVVGTTNMDIGGDLKIGLGTNVTLDATINPDFGQVESDPSVLNLTAFETILTSGRHGCRIPGVLGQTHLLSEPPSSRAERKKVCRSDCWERQPETTSIRPGPMVWPG